MNKNLQKQVIDSFCQVLADVQRSDDIKSILEDLLDSDLEKYSKYLAGAYWHTKGRPENIIKNNLKLTNKEMAQIKSKLSKKGIKLAIKHQEAEEWANKWIARIRKIKGSK